MEKIWNLTLTYNETIALARAIAAHLETLSGQTLTEETALTLYHLSQITEKFPDDEEFIALAKQAEAKEKAKWN